MTATIEQVKRFYDRFAERQDRQGWYEDDALGELARAGEFQTAKRIVEFGCGTGRFASSLLSSDLPGDARYLGFDVSSSMVSIASARLAEFGPRAPRRAHRRSAGASRR